jgi:peroxiredoxin Q/BCP
VSFDTRQDNRGFAEQQSFPFPLLSDVERVAGQAYETVRHPDEPSPQFAKRRTYLIDPDGIVRKAYRVTDISSHADQVLADLAALQNG